MLLALPRKRGSEGNKRGRKESPLAKKVTLLPLRASERCTNAAATNEQREGELR